MNKKHIHLMETLGIDAEKKTYKINKELWKKYAERDLDFIDHIISNVPDAIKHTFEKAVNQLHKYGITFLHNVFDSIEIENMQYEYNQLLTKKPFRHNMSFDGNSGEKYLSECLYLSDAVANSTIRNIIEVYYGQPINLSYEKMCTDTSKKGYREKTYRPH